MPDGCLHGGAAFKESWRTPILLYGLIEKAFMVFLVVSNVGQSFSDGFYVPAMMDSVITVWSIAYFTTLKRDKEVSG